MANTNVMEKNLTAVEVFDRCAHEYQEKFMEFALYHDTFDIFCRTIQIKNAAILELACGPGNVTKYILGKLPDVILLGTDLSPAMLELAKANNPRAKFVLMDCREMATLKTKYDGIICGFGLPYLSKSEAIQLITNAAKILNPHGVLYLSTMEDDYSNSGLKSSSSGEYQTFIHYHEAEYLKTALYENGFAIVDLQRKDYPGNSDAKDLIIIAQLQQTKLSK